jgi:hypothetical protein
MPHALGAGRSVPAAERGSNGRRAEEEARKLTLRAPARPAGAGVARGQRIGQRRAPVATEERQRRRRFTATQADSLDETNQGEEAELVAWRRSLGRRGMAREGSCHGGGLRRARRKRTE